MKVALAVLRLFWNSKNNRHNVPIQYFYEDDFRLKCIWIFKQGKLIYLILWQFWPYFSAYLFKVHLQYLLSMRLFSHIDAVCYNALISISFTFIMVRNSFCFFKVHWYLIIYKAILGMLPSYLCCLIKQKAVEKYFLHSLCSFCPIWIRKKGFYIRSSVWL